MPLSELYGMPRRRIESTHQKNINCSTDLSFIPENDLLELVWENGQIVMHEQSSSRARKSSNSDTVPSFDIPSHMIKSKTGRIGTTDSLSNNSFPGEMRLSEDDEMAPWLNYHIDDQDYCSDFLTGLSGVTENELSTSQSNFGSPKTSPHSLSANNGARVEQARVPKTSSFMNFSHFARPAAILKAATNNVLNNIGAVSSPTALPSIVKMGCKDKGPVPSYGFNNGINSKPVDEPRPAVASSSVGSVSGQDRTSNDQPNDLKRKCHDTEESDCPSDDVEEESVGAKKEGPTRGGSGSKRSRAAEVHNLSERRRRDRINEKMRALQELIPNCNKVDKASMLDEAIEYLKTLQVQVQIMSMGAGMYMPPMMMQHMHASHISHLSHMGMGFGMGMLDTNGTGSSPGYPVMQGGPPFPFPGPSSLHGMSGPNLQMFGHASQGLPVMSAAPPTSSNHAYNLKEQMRNIKLQNTDAKNDQSVNTID